MAWRVQASRPPRRHHNLCGTHSHYFRTNSPTMEISKKWFQSPHSTNTPLAYVLNPTQLIETSTMANSWKDPISPNGTTYTPTETSSILIEEQPIPHSTTKKKNIQSSNGRCMTLVWSFQRANFQPSTNQNCSNSTSTNLTIRITVNVGIADIRGVSVFIIDLLLFC